ncbi:MAG: hypothetical protein ACTMIU_08270 [Alcaligenes aquatilis]
MTQEQFLLLAQILHLSPSPELEHETQRPDGPLIPEAQQILALHHQLKQAYVIHRPTAFRVVVSHDDLDRFPGALDLKQGMRVQLVSYISERYINVRITEVPSTPKAYFRGMVTEQNTGYTLFEVGDSVYFSEDQVHAVLKPSAGRHP